MSGIEDNKPINEENELKEDLVWYKQPNTNLILKLVVIFVVLTLFFGILMFAFQIELWIALPIAAVFEIVAAVLLLIKRKKPDFPLKQITGIMIIVVGIGSIAIPFVAQSITAKHQKEMISTIEDYFANIDQKENTEDTTSAENSTSSQEVVTNEALEKEGDIINNLKKEEIYGIIEIPSIDIKYAIVQGTDKINLRSAVGHMTEGVDAGGDGNCIIAGHRGGYYGEFFKNIDKLENGAEIYITDLNNNTYTYYVYEQKWIGPYDWEELQAIPGERTLTLLSCEENGELRIIVRARIME